ncbi:MAG: adenosylmethionine decarboxylase, partial [Shewanella sp.]
VSYQRKNEYQGHLQPTSFAQDIAMLRQLIPGKAWRLGQLDSHHHYFFCSDGSYRARADDCTLELLMYHIGADLADDLQSEALTPEGMCARLGLAALFPEFDFDTHLFDPLGFSLNGLWGAKYLSVHITPAMDQRDGGSYVSFETNLDLARAPQIIARLLGVFSPQSFDLIGFNQSLAAQPFAEFLCLGRGFFTTEQGYNIDFSHYQRPHTEVLIPELM